MPLKLKFPRPEAPSPMFSAALAIVKVLRDHGRKAFFAGGAARDMLLGRAPHDIDIVTSARPEEIQSWFEKTCAIGASFGVVTVLQDGYSFETATLREEREYLDGRRPEKVFYTDDEQLDVARRDFTVNGILYDPLEEEMLDFVGGTEDLRRGILRTIGNPERRFSEDYLRILRAARFAVRLGFELEKATELAMTALAPKLKHLSGERIRDELEKMLLGPHPAHAFRLMQKTGILKIVLPEVSALEGVEQPPEHHPEGDVFTHTMLMLEKMCHPTRELAWSVLLHDIGKKATAALGRDGNVHFYGHEKTGSEMSAVILSRLKCSSALITAVEKCVAGHMRFAFVDRMKRSTWLKMIGAPTFPTEMELNRVDCASCHGKMDGYLLMLDRWIALADKPALPPLPINGNDLIRLGFRPGVRLGLLLGELRDLFLEGVLTTREELLEHARRELPPDAPESPIRQKQKRKARNLPDSP